MTYYSINEAAEQWNLTPRRLQQLCTNGAIVGAVKDGRTWRIPSDAYVPIQRPNRKRTKTLLPLPIGIADYRIASTEYYYIDKTLLIRDFLDRRPKVSLFTRPRRFGKTLNMDMLRVFFENRKEDTSIYFLNKKIWKCGEEYRSYQGQYPVIFLSLKDSKFDTWEATLNTISKLIQEEYGRHSELADNPDCNPVEKEYYRTIVAGTNDEVELSRSLAILSSMLCKAYRKEVVIIIDEYDTPIQQGYVKGFYDQAINFIRNLFSGAFKDNPNLAFGFLTGILRVAKESIFSGLNNLKVNTIMDERYNEYFGFTRREVLDMLAYYGQKDKLKEVCEWYDGYDFGGREIFNPWSVINYVDENFTPKAFWQSTGSNEIIGDILSSASPEIMENLRKLMQGEPLTALVDTDVIYPDVKRNQSSIYSFLLMAGYLKNAEILPQNDGSYLCKIAIPNKEIAFVYAKEIIERAQPINAESTANTIKTAILEKDTTTLQRGIEQFLLQTISVYDTSSEAFYQGLMIGLCAILNDRYTVRSNRESGLGRFDIQLSPIQKNLPGFIFELKASKNTDEDLDKLAGTAIQQIKDKKYDAELREQGCGKIIHVGIAFRGKEVAIKSEAQ